MKKCPFCSEEIQDDAIKCRYCGEFLSKKNPPKNRVQEKSIKSIASWRKLGFLVATKFDLLLIIIGLLFSFLYSLRLGLIFIIIGLAVHLIKKHKIRWALFFVIISLIFFLPFLFQEKSVKLPAETKKMEDSKVVKIEDKIKLTEKGKIEKTEKEIRGESKYQIADEKDISMKALIKPLSSYSTEELVNLPINIRKKYSILVSPDLPKEEYVKIFDNIILDITRKNKDIDEISLWIYDDADALGVGYNVARVLWCPSGGWETVTPEIASSNNRMGYTTTIEWSDKYKMKFEGGILKVTQDNKENQIKDGSESSNYKYSIAYPEGVKLGQVNKIELIIFNKSNKNDESLTVENRDITKGDGIARLQQDWDKSAFRIMKIEPEPKKVESILGATYFDYEGLKAKETKNILLYFKITKEGNYQGKITFYTDKHGDEEYELISILAIKCQE